MLVTQPKYINLLHIFIIVVVGLILTLPALFYGIFDAPDLIPYHLKWSKHFAEQFWQGDLYPRWLMDMNAGLGSPTFFFYPPIPYYFTSLFHPLFANDTQGWYQLSLSASFALVASGFTAYIWLKSITNQNSALLGSIVYMSLPYHIAIDLYWRYAFAEYWSFVWMPLILYFTQKLITGHKANTVGFAVSSAMLCMTHLPTFIIFYPMTLSYLFFMTNRLQRKKALIRIVIATMNAVGLSAIYWLPAMTEQGNISMYLIMQDYYFYGKNFLFSNHPDQTWQYLEIYTVVVGILAGSTFRKIRHNSSLTIYQRESSYWMSIAAIALFMTLPLSKPIWDVVTVIQRLQYPWRFNTILTIATSALLALAVDKFQQPIHIFSKKTGVGVLLTASLLLSVIQVLPLVQFRFNFPQGRVNTVFLLFLTLIVVLGIVSLKILVSLADRKTAAISLLLVASLLLSSGLIIKTRLSKQFDIASWMYAQPESQISLDAAEYRVRGVSPKIFQPDIMSELGKNNPASIATEQGSLTIRQRQPRKIVLQVNAITDTWLTINQFYYPGWTARINSGAHLLPAQPSKEEGLLRVKVPYGKHSIIITLDAGVAERTGQIISAVSLLIALLLLFWRPLYK